MRGGAFEGRAGGMDLYQEREAERDREMRYIFLPLSQKSDGIHLKFTVAAFFHIKEL